MIKKEWSHFLKDWWLKIVVIAIIAIPSIYAGIFLGSIWDPYGNTQEIPVAVVNKDKEVEYNNSTLNVGKALAKNLKNNDSMCFKLVDSKTASQGLADGNYYMVITIPDDFSKNATTLLDKSPQKMILNYTTNPGSSYIASKMDDSAIAKIKAEVSSMVTKTYAKTIFEQLGTVGSKMGKAADGSNQINDGVIQLSDGNKIIYDNLNVLASSSITFKDGASSLTNGLQDYTDGVVTVNNGIYSLKDGIDTLNTNTPTLANGISQLDNGANALQSGLSQYTSGVSAAYQGSRSLVNNNETINNSINDLAGGTSKLKSGNQQINNGLNQIADQINTASISISKYSTLISTLQNTGNEQLAQIILNNGLNKEDVEKYGLSSFGISDALPSSYQLIQQISSNLTNLNNAASTIATSSQTIQTGLNNLDAVLNGGNYTNNDGSTTNISTNQSLTAGVQNYLNGVSQINNGLSQLDGKSRTLNDGANNLTAGTFQLASQTPNLTDGINALDQGAKQLADGTSALVSNNSTLLNGAGQLTNGASQISDGAGQLADGSNTLSEGLTTLQDGSTALSSSLSDGAKQVNKINANDATIDMLATPVTTLHQEISTVENNGHGMAPYMMSVGLYVACMAFTLMYPLFNDVNKAKSGFKYWLSKASIWFTVSTAASIVMIASLMIFCNFTPQQLLMTFVLAVIAGAGFMALVTLLSIVCGKIGEFILLVFMVINLGGSAGTYPLETSSAVYKIIHPFVPFTYSVDGFRKVISMTNISINSELMVFAGIIIVCSILTIIAYNHRIQKPKPLIPQAFENVNE